MSPPPIPLLFSVNPPTLPSIPPPPHPRKGSPIYAGPDGHWLSHFFLLGPLPGLCFLGTFLALTIRNEVGEARAETPLWTSLCTPWHGFKIPILHPHVRWRAFYLLPGRAGGLHT